VPLGNSAETSPLPPEDPLEDEEELDEEALVAAAWEDEVGAAAGVLLGVGVGVVEVVGFSAKTAALIELEAATGVEDGMGIADVEGAGAGGAL
jgi:hypothetical protein